MLQKVEENYGHLGEGMTLIREPLRPTGQQIDTFHWDPSYREGEKYRGIGNLLLHYICKKGVGAKPLNAMGGARRSCSIYWKINFAIKLCK